MRRGIATWLCAVLLPACYQSLRASSDDDSLDEPGRDAGPGPDDWSPADCTETVEPTGRWTAERFTEGTEVHSPALAIDPSGFLHVSYFAGEGYSIYYATNATGEWVTERLEDDAVTYESSIALDREGGVHILYGSQREGALRHAHRADGQWAFETIREGGPAYRATMVIDSVGVLHVSESVSNGDGVHPLMGCRYLRGRDGDWSVEDLAWDDWIGYATTIAIGADGAVHIVYLQGHQGSAHLQLVHATNGSGAWQSEVVDPAIGEFSDRQPGLGVGPSGRVHVAYPAFASDGDLAGEVRYAARDDAGTWAVTVVDPDADTLPWAVMLALDGDFVHLAYDYGTWGPGGFDDVASHFRHASDECGCWKIDAVDDEVTLGPIALDPSGVLHAIYPYGVASGLRHASRPVHACE